MDNFCECDEPDIVNEETDAYLTVRCRICGMEAVGTNPSIFERCPYEFDEQEYCITVTGRDNDKLQFVRFVRRHLSAPYQDVIKLYNDNTPVVLLKDKGKPVYDMCLTLRNLCLHYEVTPDYPHLVHLTKKSN